MAFRAALGGRSAGTWLRLQFTDAQPEDVDAVVFAARSSRQTPRSLRGGTERRATEDSLRSLYHQGLRRPRISDFSTDEEGKEPKPEC